MKMGNFVHYDNGCFGFIYKIYINKDNKSICNVSFNEKITSGGQKLSTNFVEKNIVHGLKHDSIPPNKLDLLDHVTYNGADWSVKRIEFVNGEMTYELLKLNPKTLLNVTEKELVRPSRKKWQFWKR